MTSEKIEKIENQIKGCKAQAYDILATIQHMQVNLNEVNATIMQLGNDLAKAQQEQTQAINQNALSEEKIEGN